MNTTDRIIDMIAEAYISVEGIEKWNSLTDAQKHDVVMTIVKDFDSAIDRL